MGASKSEGPHSSIDHALDHARHVLPAQGPIGSFIHHNTLHAFQAQPFHEAIREACELYGTEGYLSESLYRTALRTGRIEEHDLDHALVRYEQFAPHVELAKLQIHDVRRALLLGVPSETELGEDLLRAFARLVPPQKPSQLARLAARVGRDRTQRDLLVALGAEDPAQLTNAVLIDFLGAYLDEGMARWHMPGRARGIVRCFREHLSVAPSMLAPWLLAVKLRLDAISIDADLHGVVAAMLGELGVREAEYAHFVARVLLELPGFSGMVARLESTPADRDQGAPPCSLLELTVVRLALALEAYALRATELGYPGPIGQLAERVLAEPEAPDQAHEAARVAALALVCRAASIDARELEALGAPFVEPLLQVIDAFDGLERRRVWHEAYERQHLREVLDAIAYHGTKSHGGTASTPRFQVAFCIDDREESIRRHFEAEHEGHVTFGVAGFFGVAMRFRAVDDPLATSLCPVVVEPEHAIHERVLDDHGPMHERRTRHRRLLARLRHETGDASRSLARGVALTPVLGLLAVLPLALRILFPRTASRLSRRISSWALPAPRTALTLDRVDDSSGRLSLPLGFTLAERADRVQGTLQNMGLVSNFAPIVAVLGHGASTVNNPHHSAYDCGACGGRNGGPNGRAFAAMANDQAVRDELRRRGIDIPESSWFVGGVHDTTTDGITFFDSELVPDPLRKTFGELVDALDRARALSAHERCRKFEHAPKNLSPERALAHVEERAVDLSQARPELGHVTNAVCIVGDRALSRGLFLDRRAFLVSYDSRIDPEARILERVLGAVVPVGAGINLEYYFSTVDNEGWGSGTKLPHNLSCLLGVMEGATGDLRTGLPRQMIEIHEPVRLLSIIEATPEAILKVAANKPEVAELATGGWVRVVSVHPETGALSVFEDGKFVPYHPERRSLPSVASAADWYLGHMGFLPPARIGRRERAA